MVVGMTTEPPSHQTRVYRFCVWGDLPDAAIAEMRRGHELSNLLIEIEKGHEARVKDAWRISPDIEEREAEIAELDEAVQEIVGRVKKYRQKHRTTKPSKELADELKAARKALKAKREGLKEEKARIYPIIKPELVKLGEQRKAMIKETYRPAVDGGLYWANFNSVRERHEAAVKAVRGRRKMGLPSNLRFRMWNGGEGTLVVQLQRQAGQPARTPGVIADPNGKYHNVGFLSPAHDPTHWATLTRRQQRKLRIGKLRFRIGSGEAAGMVEVPVFVHRPIPPDADICFMEIKRARLGRRFRTHVSVVVRLPITPMRVEGHRVAMHVGWRALADGALRVAVIAGMTSMPPDELDGVVRMHVGWAEVVVPSWYRQQMEYVHSLSSVRGKNLDVMKKWFLAWLEDHPDHGIVGIEYIDKWRSADRFCRLIERLVKDDALDDEARTYLAAWRKQDIHVRETEDNLRDKVIARRNNAFSNVAAWLLEEAGLLVIDNFNIARMARKPDITQKDSEAHQAARANRVLAAPGALRQRMIDGANRRGVHVQTVDGTISGIHHICGEEFGQQEREDAVMIECEHCKMMVDQDANALELLKGRAADVGELEELEGSADELDGELTPA
jgi:hypothetical protein